MSDPLPHAVRDQIDHIMDVFDFAAVLAHRKANVNLSKEEFDCDLRREARRLLEDTWREEAEDTWRERGSFMVIKIGDTLTLVGVIDSADINH